MKNPYNEWDVLEEFHKRTSAKNPLDERGVESFLEISKFAKKLELKVPKHPSFNVRFNSNAHYNWLIKINKLLKIISKIPNFEPRIKEFFNNDDYFDSLSALYELEMALKLKLEGFEVAFTEEKAPDKTPDMEVRIADRLFNLEVTTINNPDQDREKQEFFSQLTRLRLKHNVMMAGNLLEIPKKDQNYLLQDIENRIVETKEKGKTIRLVQEGRFILEIEPIPGTGGLTSTGFHFVHRELKDIEDKVNQIIYNKNNQLSVNKNPGILCIYGGSRTINIGNLYTKTYDKINPYLQTFPNLSALVLSSYSDFYPIESLSHLKPIIGSKTLRELKPGFGEMEQSIIWKNSAASFEMPTEFIKSYDTFEYQQTKIS